MASLDMHIKSPGYRERKMHTMAQCNFNLRTPVWKLMIKTLKNSLLKSPFQNRCHKWTSFCSSLLTTTKIPASNARNNQRRKKKVTWLKTPGLEMNIVQGVLHPYSWKKVAQAHRFLILSLTKEGSLSRLIPIPEI